MATTGEYGAGTRRHCFTMGAAAAVVGGAGAVLRSARPALAAGATDDFQPYPIPWLDKNLHYNQIPMPDGPPTELSHIYHSKGQVGRALFTGEGTTGDGKTPYIGQGTDYGYLDGTFIPASGEPQLGTFTHIWLALYEERSAPESKVHDSTCRWRRPGFTGWPRSPATTCTSAISAPGSTSAASQ
ncbi:hypothetical protein SAMN05661080_02180 [Modestobacter sp. DSM 44400]|uniref:hypothetical protein n=1 Tax=Modestobacter sp. DSM 44400 TaxID=1550230 RepID=UPI0008954F78|nr:hypothetical protein [Modestobacter sp. DSM 44400]SDY05755.1 hypothetical protein SAMN05661080_02180 [Modestobacter sp. DSM 44400]